MLVSKIIHQTIRDKNKLHPLVETNILHLKATNPDWDYRLYDDDDIREFISRAYGTRKLKIFDRIQHDYGAAKADFFRYLVIYHDGGVYLDIKSTADKPLSEVIRATDSIILSHWNEAVANDIWRPGQWSIFGVPNEFQQWHLIARPGHPYLAEVLRHVEANIERYDPRKLGVGTMGTLRTTGPIAYSLAIQPMLSHGDHRLVDIGDFGFRYSIFEDVNPSKAGLTTHRGLIGSSYARAQGPVASLSPTTSALYLLYRAKRKFNHVLGLAQPAKGARAT